MWWSTLIFHQTKEKQAQHCSKIPLIKTKHLLRVIKVNTNLKSLEKVKRLSLRINELWKLYWIYSLGWDIFEFFW